MLGELLIGRIPRANVLTTFGIDMTTKISIIMTATNYNKALA